MCGIVGYYYCSEGREDLKEALAGAVSSLVHRGPNDMGVISDLEGRLGLGHRRLSVIDLSEAGRQPMATEDGRAWVVYNGEVYNFKKIREELEGLGHSFKSGTDTEVILKAYIQWGIRCLDRLIGMFAFGLFDRREMTLYLARDRLGIKPLYYYRGKSFFIFASELKALMAFPAFPRVLNEEALALYLHYQYVPGPLTIFKDTSKLPPGHYLKFNGEDIALVPYWDVPREHDPATAEEASIDELEELITTVARDHLVSDVPVGALLSGGTDSTIVAALLQKVAGNTLKTFSIGFKERSYDEAPLAARAARYLGTEHTELYVTPADAMKVIPMLPGIYDEPFADASAVPTCLVSSLARSHVTVALSGDGGDEQFCGYVRYWWAASMFNYLREIPSGLQSVVATLMAMIPLDLADRLYSAIGRIAPRALRIANFRDKWYKAAAAIGEESLEEIYRAMVCVWSHKEVLQLTGKDLREGIFEESIREAESLPTISRLMRTDLLTYLPDCMLTKVDRASMAVGLEVRVPLLDHRVVEFSSRLPPALKYRNGVGKYILKKLLSRYVPRSLIDRPKMGFALPIDNWLRKELKELLTDYLSWERLAAEGLFSPSMVHGYMKEHLAGRAAYHHRLWAILMWEMWRDRWLGGGASTH